MYHWRNCLKRVGKAHWDGGTGTVLSRIWAVLPKSCTLPVPDSCWARVRNSGLIHRWVLEVPLAGAGHGPGELQVCVKTQTLNLVMGKNLWPWTGTSANVGTLLTHLWCWVLLGVHSYQTSTGFFLLKPIRTLLFKMFPIAIAKW